MISRYALVGPDDIQRDPLFDNYLDAITVAAGQGCAVIELEYEFVDSQLVWTPDHSGTWPPSADKEDDDD